MNNIKEGSIIVPRRINLGNIKAQYRANHHGQDLDDILDIIYELFPDYEKTVDDFLKQTYIYPHNMFVMHINDFNKYCHFIFTIYDELNKRYGWKSVDDVREYIKKYNYRRPEYNLRIHAFLNERICNIFYMRNFQNIKEAKVITC